MSLAGAAGIGVRAADGILVTRVCCDVVCHNDIIVDVAEVDFWTVCGGWLCDRWSLHFLGAAVV